MAYRVVTAVTTEPVLLAEARLHLRCDSDVTSEDTIITALIVAAREFAETHTSKALAPQTLELVLDEFPRKNGDILLDMPPVASITSIKYTDENGVEQTLAASKYALSLHGEAWRVSVTFGNDWPVVQEVANAVRVIYITGYTTAPKAVKAAILLLVGHLYENRSDTSGLSANQIPTGARGLLDTVKLWGC